MRQYETYKCNKCGNIVEVQSVGGGELHCCGEAMEMITENLTLVNLMKSFAGESEIGRASCRKECSEPCRTRGSPDH